MSERIEELRQECERAERIMSGSGVQACLTVSTGTIIYLIDTVMALRAENERLRGALELVKKDTDAEPNERISYEAVMAVRSALAASGEKGGGS